MNDTTSFQTLNSDQPDQSSTNKEATRIVIYCDGAGCRPNGAGSGFAWIQPDISERHIEQIDGLSNNQAEYHALISALEFIPDGSAARIFTDSELMCSQVNGKYKVRNTNLKNLFIRVNELIRTKHLKIDLQWVPREKNLAGKLL